MLKMFGYDGRQYCWRRSGNALQEHHVRSSVQHGGESVMICACMTWKGVGKMTKMDGIMHFDVYREILKPDLLDTDAWQQQHPEAYVSLQDNDPKHVSRLLKHWISDQDFDVMDWSAQSPDMNPIEPL